MDVANIKFNERYDVYVGRPSKWGNPFVLKREADRSLIIAQYFKYIRKQEVDFKELKGKTLGCYCHPKPCHAHILWALANDIIDEFIGAFSFLHNSSPFYFQYNGRPYFSIDEFLKEGPNTGDYFDILWLKFKDPIYRYMLMLTNGIQIAGKDKVLSQYLMEIRDSI